MATTLEIWRTGGGSYTDYSNWLYDVPLKTHPLNQPQTFEFSLTNGVAGLVVPEAGNRVRFTTGAWGVTFVGYALNTPELEVLGADKTGAAVYGYKLKCIDESVRLEWNCSSVFPALQPFVNQYQGQIVKGLIAALGGGYTTTNVDNGILIPYFRVKPEESFWDAVRRLSDRTNMKLWFSNGAANYKSYGDAAFSPSPAESDSQFNPYNLSVSPVDNPVFNDVTGVGNPEPQTFAREHFVGDGITAAFPLKMVPFGAASSILQADDWTEAVIDANRWTETDVNSLISLNAGSLRFLGGPVATGSRLTAVQGLEIAGKVELRAGRFRFTGANNAILGGLFSSDTGALADCVAGFRATPSGANTVLQPIVSGAVAGPTYQVVAGKSYNLVIVVDCSQAVRRRRPFFSLATSFGGENVAADARVSFYVLEIVDGDPDSLSNAANTVISHTATITNIQQFLLFTLLSGPMNGSDSVNMVCNFTYIHKPVQCEVWTRVSGASSWKRERLGDKAQPDIRCAVNATQQSAQVIFVAGQEPAQSERVRVVYRGAGLARARVKKASSITAEASKSGDSGVRSAVLSQQQPPARDTSELERQIQAYIDDATTPLYSGTWTFDSKLYSVGSVLVPGRVITVNAPTRYASFTALVTEVKQKFECFDKDGTTEIFRFDVTFGPLLRLQDEQENFLPAEDAMVGPLDSVTQMSAVDTANIGTNFAADVPEADFDLTLTASSVEIDAGRNPTAAYDVRKTDEAWGSASTLNRMFATTSRIFGVPRSSRDVCAYLRDASSLTRDTPTFRQKVQVNQPSGNQAKWTYTLGTVQAGSLLVYAWRPHGGTVAGITDTQGNTWVQLYASFWYALNCKAGATTVTVAFTGNSDQQGTVAEYSGVANIAPDVSADLASGTGMTATSTARVPTVDGDLILGWGFNATTNSPVYMAGGSFTLETGSNINAFLEDWVQPSAGSISASLSITTSVNWSIGIVAFKASVSASGNLSRYSSLVRVAYPLVPNRPLAQFDYSDLMNIKLKIDPAILTDVNAFGFEVRAKDNVTVVKRYGYLILTDADLTVNLTDVVRLSSKDAAATGSFGADAFLVTRHLDFYIYAWNLLGEYSGATHLLEDIPGPIAYNLAVDETAGKLTWSLTPSGTGGSEIMFVELTSPTASRFKVEVATDSGYTNVILTKIVTDKFIALDDENVLRPRWFRVTPGDAYGWGTALTLAHSHTPAAPVTNAGAAVNNTDNTYSIPAIPTPTTDITPDSSFSSWGDELKDRARKIYMDVNNY